MKKVLKVTSIVAAVLLVLAASLYLMLGYYYKGGFPCFTWINGVYCTGKSVDEVNLELLQGVQYDGLAVMDTSGARLFVSAADVDMTVDYTAALTEAFDNTDPLKWGVYAFKGLNHQYEPTITVNKDKLGEIISGWEIFVDPSDLECTLERTSEGYVLENAIVNIPDAEKITDLAYSSMMGLASVLDLANYDDCFKEYDLRGRNKDKVGLFAKLDEVQNIDITYSLQGEMITLDKARASCFVLTQKDLESAAKEKPGRSNPGLGRFIINGQECDLPEEEDLRLVEGVVTDAELNPIVSESRMYDFLQDIAISHSTGNLMDLYRQGKNNTIIINMNSRGDGSIFDISSEFEYLRSQLVKTDVNEADTKEGNVLGEKKDDKKSAGPEVRELLVRDSVEAFDAAEQLGQTYIEVNMGKQMLYYYVDGVLNMEMPVVTGNINRGRGTPTGIYPIYNKRYHTYLRGADYVSYVNYWLGVHKGVGIHDANWRNKFGDEIYKSDGSHGCINCPFSSVEELWNVVEIGTPAILYY